MHKNISIQLLFLVSINEDQGLRGGRPLDRFPICNQRLKKERISDNPDSLPLSLSHPLSPPLSPSPPPARLFHLCLCTPAFSSSPFSLLCLSSPFLRWCFALTTAVVESPSSLTAATRSQALIQTSLMLIGF